MINSILDNDLYKFTQQNFVLQQYSEADAVYVFNNRDKGMKYNPPAFVHLQVAVNEMKNLRLTDDEYEWIKKNIYFLGPMYRQYLSNYRFNPDQVKISLNDENELNVRIEGKWRENILWEVPLMALISEMYFKYVDTNWNMDNQDKFARSKAELLSDAKCFWADFGTRRRRNFEIQDIVVREMKVYKGFVGTSNVYLAMKHGVKAIGTLGHEAIQAVSALESMNHPNKYLMEKWAEVYKGDLGTMLPDTYGLISFLKDFTLEKALLWNGLRHDSGDPYVFTDRVVDHYNKLRIDPMTKTLIFSDGLNEEAAVKINNYCKGKTRCSFGIGTHFTNCFHRQNGDKSKAMNMVIKLQEINGIPVVKLSDTPTKAIGDPKMIEIMKYIHLDQGK